MKSDLREKLLKRLVPALLDWYAANARDLPWRRTKDPYAVFISELMLQQTQVKTVIPYFERWMKAFPTVKSLARARPEKVLKMWEGLGYYSRARNAQAAARLIVEGHGGKFPEKFEDILALPGIGRYTAGAISSIAFNQPHPILDGNVVRVLTRLFEIEGNPRDKLINEKLWKLAADLVLVDTQHCSELNQSLMELGALVCLPRQPKCAQCPVRKNCLALRENRVEELPMLAARPVATERRFMAFIARKDDRFLVRQREAGQVNAHLWEFPNREITLTETDLAGAAKPFRLDDPRPVCRVRHSITRYRILLEAFEARIDGGAEGLWKTLTQLKKLPFTSAHRKILGNLEAQKPG